MANTTCLSGQQPAILSSVNMCNPGFYCPNNTERNPPQHCPPTLECLLTRLQVTNNYCGEAQGTYEPIICRAGFYCPSGGKQQLLCPRGFYCPVGSVAPFKCMPLSVCPNGSEREIHLTGFLCCALIDIALLVLWLWPWLRRLRNRSNGTTKPHPPSPKNQPVSSDKRVSNDNYDTVVMRNDISGTVGMDMAFDKVTFSIEGMDNLILDSVSGQAQSGMLLGVMGPSGSGKSTLINILCGRLRATSGSLLLDGVPVNWSDLQKFQGLFGFIPQDDVVHPHLTVWENIMYSAKIRLGGTLKHREIENLVYQIILDLELEKVKNSVVGNEDRRGISGGERKRVSIALELVATPPVLLLDEPTSGLDSQAALSLIMLLKSLSRKGTTVICVVHQPRIEIFEALDKVLLMGSGKTVYFGPQSLAVRHFHRMGYEFDPRLNPADIMMDIVFGTYAGKQSSIVKSFNDEDANSSMKAVAKRTSATGDQTVNALMVQCHRYRQRYSPWYKQIYLAFCRDMTQQSRAAWSFILEIAGGTLCGLLLGLSVYEFRGHIYQGMFLEPFHVLSSAVDYTLLAQLGTLNCLATSFAAAAPSVIVFSAERRIFFRESFSGHSNFAYFGGKVLTTLLRSVISSLHFSTMFIILASPVISFGMLVGLNILYFYCVYGLGSIIAAITDHENGPLFCLLLNIVIAIFGGASPRLATVKSWHLEWFWYLCPGLWFCEAFFSAQVLPFSYLYNTEEAEAFTGYKFGRTGLDIGLLLVIGTLYRIIGCFLMILKARTRYGRSS